MQAWFQYCPERGMCAARHASYLDPSPGRALLASLCLVAWVNGPLGTYSQGSIGLNAECTEVDQQLIDFVIESTRATTRSCLVAVV